MAVSKVVFDGDTLIDLTSDTVSADTLAEGVTAHGANGEEIVGTMSISGGNYITKPSGATVGSSLLFDGTDWFASSASDGYYPSNQNSVYSFSNLAVPGLMTNSKKTLIFGIPVDKSISEITSFSAISLTGGIRCTAGYISDGANTDTASNWITGSNISAISIIKSTRYMLSLSITLKSASSTGTNNTPIVGRLNGSLKFN